MFFELFPFSLSEQIALFFLTLSFLMHVGLGFVVWRYALPSIAKRFFLLLVFVETFQIAINFLSTLRWINDEIFLWGGRVAMVSAITFVYLLFLFVYTFLQKKPKLKLRRGRIYLLHFFAIVLIGVSMTPFLFSGVRHFDYGRVPQFSLGVIPHAVFTIGLTVATFFLIFWRYFHAGESDKRKWRYIVIGLVLTFSLLFSLIYLSLIVFHDLRFAPYSGILTLPFVIFASYAILKHHCLDIRIFGTELFAFLIIGISMVQLAFARTVTELLFSAILLILLVLFAILLIRSMTREIKHRADEIALEELQKLDAAKSEFITIASHQLRTPLSGLKGYISMAQEESYGKLPAAMQRILGNMMQATERLISLADSFLNVSRMQSGKIELNRQETDVKTFLDALVHEMRPAAEKRGLNLMWKMPSENLPHVSIDQEKIRTVLTGVLDNAIRYTEKGGVAIQIKEQKTHLRQGYGGQSRGVLISVADTGKGLTPEERKDVFTSFKRGKTAQALWTEGVGLSLYIAKQLVEAHNGRIWAESPGPGQGTTFFVELPIA